MTEKWSFTFVLQPQDLGTLQILSWPWTPLDPKVLERLSRIQGNRAVIPSIPVNLQIYNRMAEEERYQDVAKAQS